MGSFEQADILSRIRQLVPDGLTGGNKKDFSRKSKLPFRKLIVFLLSSITSGKSKGIDTKSADFFKDARRSGLLPDAEAVHRSTVTKARSKVPSEVFDNILNDARDLAYEVWPEDPRYQWHGMSVIAIDGSKYDLPASKSIRKEFDPESGLDHPGRGHYPQCLVSTAFDVLRKIPVARTIVSIPEACEREQAKVLIKRIPLQSIVLFDRGYPSYELICYLNANHDGKYLFRCPLEGSFAAVSQFGKSGKIDDTIWIHPSGNYISKVSPFERKKLKAIKLRAVKIIAPDGTESVLLTNAFKSEGFFTQEIIELYFKRWGVETYYKDEKETMEVEKFHSRTPNGIRQEIIGAAIISTITRIMMVAAQEDMKETGEEAKCTVEPQFKNAVEAVASDLAVLVTNDPAKAIAIFKEIINEIRRVKYYRPKTPRPSAPRVCKKPINKWAEGKAKKLAA